MSHDLLRRRERLTREFAELQYDLGGLAYEMAIRDHVRLDVLVRRAARLQEVDAELGEVERLVRLDEAGAGGSCSHCGALHGHASFYCWRCGERLVVASSSATAVHSGEPPFTNSSPPRNTQSQQVSDTGNER
jgi:hypothetical protein